MSASANTRPAKPGGRRPVRPHQIAAGQRIFDDLRMISTPGTTLIERRRALVEHAGRADADKHDASIQFVRFEIAGENLPCRDEAPWLRPRIIDAPLGVRPGGDHQVADLMALTPVCAPNAVCRWRWKRTRIVESPLAPCAGISERQRRHDLSPTASSEARAPPGRGRAGN